MDDVVGGPERRRHERYAVRVPIATDRGKGFTCEMSVVGLSFNIDYKHVPGELIAMTITFRGSRGMPLEAHCAGRVLRAEATENGWHVAATIDRFGFSRRSSF